MRWRRAVLCWRSVVLLLLVWVAATAEVRGQGTMPVFDATALTRPVDLGTKDAWVFQGGDDLAYARPDFDDSKWKHYDAKLSLNDQYRKPHPAVMWYRLHMKVSPQQKDLALKENWIASPFEIYANGLRLIESGRMEPREADTTSGWGTVRVIPNEELKDGRVVVAVRVSLTGIDGGPMSGWMGYSLMVGPEEELWNHLWLDAIGENALSGLSVLLGLSLGIISLTLFLAQRNQREYLWIFFQFLFLMLEWIPLWEIHRFPLYWLAIRALLPNPAIFQILMYLAFLGISLNRRWKVLLGASWIVNSGPQLLAVIPHYFSTQVIVGLSFLTSLPLSVATSVVIPILLVKRWRRGNNEAGILLIPAILSSLSDYTNAAILLGFMAPRFLHAAAKIYRFAQDHVYGPFHVGLSDLTQLSYILVLTVILLLRSTRMSRQQAVLEGEVEAARQVQQVILPNEIERIKGFSVECAYLPAKQVGGDFFQIIPMEGIGLMLVIGDVAGKGIPAAMLVALAVGIIRTAANDGPGEMLAVLNDRLVGRCGGGFSTALAALITCDGEVTIANAGHLSPYLDGREIELPGALPLGIVAGASYESTAFRLEVGSRLTFYSDGIVEAQTAKGQLLGFERGREMSTRPAAEIAAAAQAFGQTDDITVVTIGRK